MSIDFDKTVITGDLKTITNAAKRLKHYYSELETLEGMMKAKKAEILALESQELPDLMDECSIKDLLLDTGERLIVKTITKAGLPTKTAIMKEKDLDKQSEMEERLNKGLNWLRDNGAEELIKNRVIIEFSKGQDNLAGDFAGQADELGLPNIRDQSIHPATLSKFVVEKISKGQDIPADTLGVYSGRKAEVKKAR